MNRLPVIVRQHIAGFRILLVFTVICGFVYPLVMLGVSQVAFHNQANGSMVSYNGHVVGSSLLCQEFVDAKGNPLPQYFQPRPSDAVVSGEKNDYGCDPLFSSASNLGPTNPAQVKLVQQRQQQIAAFDHVPVSAIPAKAAETALTSPPSDGPRRISSEVSLHGIAARRESSPMRSVAGQLFSRRKRAISAGASAHSRTSVTLA